MTLESIAQERGLERLEVSFAPFTEPKVKWQRTSSSAFMQVSDYFDGAPSEVIEGLADHILDRIAGNDKAPYPKAVMDYIADMMGDMNKVNTYIERHGENAGIEHLPEGGLIVRGTKYRERYSATFLVAFSDRNAAEVGEKLESMRATFIQGAGL